MSSFFSTPGAQKKRKRDNDGPAPKRPARLGPTTKPRAAPKKRVGRVERAGRDDDISSGSDLDSDAAEDVDMSASESDEHDNDETAAEKRLRLASQYLSRVREEVEATGWDAEQIDKDMIAARLEDDVAESKGKVFRHVASEIDLDSSPTMFRDNTHTVTAVALCSPLIYLVTKDSQLIKYRLQPPPSEQYKQTTRKRPKKQAPPRKRPQRLASVKGSSKRSKDRNFKGHVGQILCVAASDDGKYVVTGGDDKRIVVWDSSLKPLGMFTHHRDAVTGVVFRRNSHQMYSCSKDRTIRVWNCDALAFVESLFGHADSALDVDALALERLVSVGADPNSLAETGSLDRVAYIDENHFITGSDNGCISLWTLSKKKPLDTIVRAHGLEDPLLPCIASSEEHPSDKVVPPPQPRGITSLRALPYSDLILSGSTDGFIVSTSKFLFVSSWYLQQQNSEPELTWVFPQRVWKFNEKGKKLESVGILGQQSTEIATNDPIDGVLTDVMDISNEDDLVHNGTNAGSVGAAVTEPYQIKGIVNDIAIISRGKMGDNETFSVVCAIGKEHRLGRWGSNIKGAKNGAVVFEIRKKSRKGGDDSQPNGVGKAPNAAQE
ncbi:putative WD repeat-containing protein [Rosellinia necatrix]|uniref:Putative WD repeat-containing protein n=1 Tax=Rosellinia necatrix TaxID=77044 RepID=A0A1W2THQ9_ROSNE|nr:putative WD repeat-containing protein [Rosellinia necatrix]